MSILTLVYILRLSIYAILPKYTLLYITYALTALFVFE